MESNEIRVSPVESQMLMLNIEKLKAFERRRDAGMALLFAFAYFALFRLTRVLPNAKVETVWLTTIFSLVFMLSFCVLCARALLLRQRYRIHLLVSAGIALPRILLPILAVTFRSALWGSVFKSPLWIVYLSLIRYPEISGLVMMWFASSLGVLVSQVIREFKILLPSALALALVDLYVVFGGGLVTLAQSGRSPAAQIAMRTFTVSLPPPPKSMSVGAVPLQLAVGFADFLFIALFFACFLKFGIPSRKTFYVLLLTLIGYMVLVGLNGVALPALVPIAVVVIGMNWKRFQFTQEEIQAMGIAGALVGVILGFLVWKSSH